MTLLEYVLLGACVVLIIAVILIAVLFLRALDRMVQFADTVHVRGQQFQDNLLDRLMAVDYTTYKAYRAAEEAEPGGWEGPEPEPTLEDQLDEAEERGEHVSLTGLHLSRRQEEEMSG